MMVECCSQHLHTNELGYGASDTMSLDHYACVNFAPYLRTVSFIAELCLVTSARFSACRFSVWPMVCIFLCRQRVIEEVQAALKGTAAEGRVSTADLIVLAGAYAVSMTGGPLVDVGIGAAVARHHAVPVEHLRSDTCPCLHPFLWALPW